MSEALTDTKYSRGEGSEDGQVTVNVQKHVSPYILFSCEEYYLRTLPGILHFTQMVLSLISLICLASSGTVDSPFLTLPLSWHSRVFIFVSVLGFLISLGVIILNVTTVIQAFPLNWNLFDLIVLGVMSFLYLVSSSLIASAASYYQELSTHRPSWATEQLVAACVLGYICFIVYAVSSFLAFRRMRNDESQFSAQHLQSQAQSTASPQCSSSGDQAQKT